MTGKDELRFQFPFALVTRFVIRFGVGLLSVKPHDFLQRLIRSIDVLVLPTTGTIYKTTAVEADPFRLNTNLGLYTTFVNLLDLTAVAAPAGFRKNGLPFGISLIAPAFAEHALLAATARFLGERG